MDNLDIFRLINFYIKKIPLIVLSFLLFGLVGYYYETYIKVSLYQSSTTIILVQNTKDGNNYTMDQNQLNLNEKLVSTYTEIVKSRKILEKVKDVLHLKRSIKQLQSQIYVSDIIDTPIISIDVRDENAAVAKEIANTIAGVFKEEISNIYKLENVTVIDTAIASNLPCNKNLMKTLLIFEGIGCGMVFLILFIIYYFDNTIEDKKDIENIVGLAVLSEVPYQKDDIKNKSDKSLKRVLDKIKKKQPKKKLKTNVKKDELEKSSSKKNTKKVQEKEKTEKTSSRTSTKKAQPKTDEVSSKKDIKKVQSREKSEKVQAKTETKKVKSKQKKGA